MLRELQIKNFKAWADSGKIRMAPLTIFCGNNSSGKSSVGQLFLMLKQTIASSDRQRVMHLGEKGSLVDLGTYRDIVFNHDENKHIEFGFNYDIQINKIVDAKNIATYGPFHNLIFDAEISYDAKSSRILLERMKYQMLNGKKLSFQYYKDQLKYQLTSDEYHMVRRHMKPHKLPPPVNFYGFPDETVAYFQNTGFLPDLSLSIYNLLKNMFYVGPLREYPERQYQFSGEIPSEVGKKGENAIKALLASRDRKIKNKNKKLYERFDELIARWLKTMGLIHSFKIESIAQGRKEFEVKIMVNKNSSEVLITEVGFGISQVLPIIVQSFFAPNNSILFFEQPEIHLHPSVQSHLGDLFIETIHAREKGSDRQVQVIVESHSEHLIRRIQRRIADETIKPEEVAFYFVHQKNGQAILEKMEIDLFGSISNWPEDFFGNDLEDLAATTQAVRDRKRNMKND